MKPNTYSRAGGLAYILAEALLLQNNEGPSLISRINLVDNIFTTVKAIIDAEDSKTISEADLHTLSETAENIDLLRDKYEPLMDDPGAKNETNTKRATAEKLLSLSKYNLKFLVQKYKLVDYSQLKDITGVTWEDS